jgi:hypothetical protein
MGVRVHRVMPLPPAELADLTMTKGGLEVVVFPKGQLPLCPGLKEEELSAIFSAYART